VSAAIQHLFDRLKAGYPAAVLGGIYANKPGYHNKRDNLPPSDYSVQRPDDQTGPGHVAAGLDVTMHDLADMARMTNRLIDLAFIADHRVLVLREFLGTIDGSYVTGMDVRDQRWITSDDSHLWHVHLSVYRRYADDMAAMDDLADAILNSPDQPPEEDDVTPEQWAYIEAMNVKLDEIQHHQQHTEVGYLQTIKDNGEGVARLVGIERDASFIQPTAQRTVDMIADVLEDGPRDA
jgi:hypothetical protein